MLIPIYVDRGGLRTAHVEWSIRGDERSQLNINRHWRFGFQPAALDDRPAARIGRPSLTSNQPSASS
jgi:hypothetical protein